MRNNIVTATAAVNVPDTGVAAGKEMEQELDTMTEHNEYFCLTASSPRILREIAADFLLDQGRDLESEALRSGLHELFDLCDEDSNKNGYAWGSGNGHGHYDGVGIGFGNHIGCGPRYEEGCGQGDGYGRGK